MSHGSTLFFKLTDSNFRKTKHGPDRHLIFRLSPQDLAPSGLPWGVYFVLEVNKKNERNEFIFLVSNFNETQITLKGHPSVGLNE